MEPYTQGSRMSIEKRIRTGVSITLLTLLAACGGGGGGDGTPPVDTTPAAFNFTDQVDIALNTATTSNAVTVGDINAAANISITGGEYAIAGGSYTSAAGTVSNGQTVTVRQTSSGNLNTTTDTTLTIGGVNDTFSVTTIADTTAPTASISFPPPVSLTEGSTIIVRGTASDDLSAISGVQVNGMDATSSDGFATWSVEVTLATGDNTLTVVTTDAVSNSNNNAAAAVIRRDVLTGSYPDANNTLLNPQGITLDNANNRALVVDNGLDAVIAVNLETGVRTVLSDNSTPDGTNPIVTPNGVVLDEVNNRVLVADRTTFAESVTAVSLVDGTRTILSNDGIPDGFNSLDSPGDMVIDRVNNRVLLMEDESVFAVDIITGARTILSSSFIPDTINEFCDPLGIALDISNTRALVTNTSCQKAITAVDINTGNRTVLSDNTTPNTDNALITPETITLDSDRNRVLVGDVGLDAIVAVDISSGQRTILSDGTTPNTDNVLQDPSGIFLVTSAYALVIDRTRNAVLAVDIINGQRVVFSK